MLIADSNATVTSKFVYGTCNPLSSRAVLCRYNIQAKELIATVAITFHCSILQIGTRIFISGGQNPIVDTLSEFMEDTKTLIKKKSMKFAKFHHSSEVISTNVFITIGGHNDKPITHCEEYSITKNQWKILISLNKARYLLGTVFLDDRFLYAIGGHQLNDIELLNVYDKIAWTMINFTFNEVRLDSNPAAFPISNTEIMILRVLELM